MQTKIDLDLNCNHVVFLMAGERAVAVARSGCQRTFAANTERTQIHFDCDGLLLQVGGSFTYAVVPPFTCSEARRGHHRSLWLPAQDPLQIAS